MSVYVTGSMLGNFLLSSFVASLMLMSDDIYSIGALFAVQGLVWSCIMGHMIIDAQEYDNSARPTPSPPPSPSPSPSPSP